MADEVRTRFESIIRGKLKELDDKRAELAAMLEESGEEAPRAVDGPTFMAEPMPSLRWLLLDMISAQSVGFLVGDSTVGKTSALVQLSLQLAAGRDLWGRTIPQPAKVLYLLAEGARPHFQGRVRHVANLLNLTGSLSRWHTQSPGTFDFDLTGTDVRRSIAQMSPDLVICDTLGYFYKGDENDATEWKRKGIGPVRQLIAEFKCAFLFVHHPRKDGAPWRGSSAFFDDADHFLRMTGEKDSNERKVIIDKNKYGPAHGNIDLTFDQKFMVFRVRGNDD